MAQNKPRTSLWVLAVAAVFVAGSLPAQELANYLTKINRTLMCWKSFEDINVVEYGKLDASVWNNELPKCNLGHSACIHAYNARYGSTVGGRNTAPWHRKGDLVGERGCSTGANCDALSAFWQRAQLPGSPTDDDAQVAKLSCGTWDTLIVPGGNGLIVPPGVGPDPCAQWQAAFEHWLATAPIPPAPAPVYACSGFVSGFDAWLAAMPPEPPACMAPPF